MSDASFLQKYEAAVAQSGAALCLGLDPDVRRLPDGVSRDAAGVERFCLALLEATAPYLCAVKLNTAFFEALGPEGWSVLHRVVRAIPPHLPVIADAKRGDIGSTAEAYATALFDRLGADAVTLNPLMGRDSAEPFLRRGGRAVFVLCATSNPGARDFLLRDGLHYRIARECIQWETPQTHVGLVVGATRPEEVAAIRAIAPRAVLLCPGVGAQGGDLAATIAAARSSAGPRLIVPVSRSILYANSYTDFASAAQREAQRLWEEMRHALTA